MLVLKRPALEPERIVLAPGAAIWARPATSYDYDVARAEMQAAAARIAAGEDTASIYGLPIDKALPGDSLRAAAAETIVNIELANITVSRFEGIANEDGSPAEPTRETLAVLMLDPGFRAAWKAVAFRELFVLSAEKNESTPSPNGAQEGASPIAADAGNPASPAPAEGAG